MAQPEKHSSRAVNNIRIKRSMVKYLTTRVEMLKEAKMECYGLELILAELIHIRTDLGFTLEEDIRKYSGKDELFKAGMSYMTEPADRKLEGEIPDAWPWPKKWWKPGDRNSELAKAGALFLCHHELVGNTMKLEEAMPIIDNMKQLSDRCAELIDNSKQ